MAHAATTALATDGWRHTSFLDRVTLYCTFGLLLFGPLAFGATEPWSIFILEAGAAALFGIWAFRQAQSREAHILRNPLFVPGAAFGALILIQLVSGRSAYTYETISAARLYCTYAILCFLVVQLLRRTSQVQALCWVISVFGAAVASFAIIQGIASNGRIYWLRLPEFGGWIYGPYVNHNHYAGLMEMLVPVPLIISLHDHVHGQARKLAIAAAAIMASSIFLSGSRGGMAAFAVQAVVVVGFLLRRDKVKLKRSAVALGIFFVILMALLAWLGGSEVLARLASVHQEAQSELSGGTRIDIDRDALSMFAQRPILGWGLGVFPDVYPEFRSFYTNFTVNAAHNDYLQLLVEMGGLGFLAMLWLVIAMYRSALRKTRKWTSDTNGAVAFAAMLGFTGILVHSFVDFNLQVPANAALFYVLAAVAAMQPRFGLVRHGSRRHAEVPARRSA
jgi:O-antigen ligase